MALSSSPSAGSQTGDLTGRLLAGRYRLNHPIASGGMAQVWEATDQVLTRRVAVKILHPHLAQDDSFVRRFRGEAIAAARLAHPSIVSVYDTVSEGQVNAIVMELVTGTTMRDDLDKHGPLQLVAVLAIGTQVADALGAAHASGLVHRDVKPANILLSADGRVLVADFGIAKAAEGADLTSDGSMVGTAKYLAPEQVEGGPVDGRTDLYALGVVLYEALTGTPPFVADTDTGTALARLHQNPTPVRRLRPEIPPAVELVVSQAMARRPDDRFPDAGAMRRALVAAGADPSQAHVAAQAAAGAITGARPAPPRLAAPPLRPSPPTLEPQPHCDPEANQIGTEPRRWPWILAGALVVAAIGVGLRAGIDQGPAWPSPKLDEVSAQSFDPFDPTGGRTENDGDLKFVTDGDSSTTWRTERYRTADVQAFKGGVGLLATLRSNADLDQLSIATPVGGWSARIYVTNTTLPAELAGWGEPVANVTDAVTGTVEVPLEGRRGKAVLIWFTRLAPMGQRFAAQVSGIAVQGS